MATMLFLTLLVSGSAPQPVVNAPSTFFALSARASPNCLTRPSSMVFRRQNENLYVAESGGGVVAFSMRD